MYTLKKLHVYIMQLKKVTKSFGEEARGGLMRGRWRDVLGKTCDVAVYMGDCTING